MKTTKATRSDENGGTNHGSTERIPSRHHHLQPREVLERVHHRAPHQRRRAAVRHERQRGAALEHAGHAAEAAAGRLRHGLCRHPASRLRHAGRREPAGDRLRRQHRVAVRPLREHRRPRPRPPLDGAPAPRLPARGQPRGLLRAGHGRQAARGQHAHPRPPDAAQPQRLRQEAARRLHVRG